MTSGLLKHVYSFFLNIDNCIKMALTLTFYTIVDSLGVCRIRRERERERERDLTYLVMVKPSILFFIAAIFD